MEKGSTLGTADIVEPNSSDATGKYGGEADGEPSGDGEGVGHID